ncbi:UDP-galactose/UDP-glucose transporter 5B [Hibiscus syriacus]|uniref:UDP-galactose/UDP-glucose transporter 5B n=1 Tax=Hibiscus syriacus TaxID=106335 RepID=A0A6A3CWT4_HIBSY|nr:UDP-galactose/UDP-glucose transporter 5B [Hibiscus syriacus]
MLLLLQSWAWHRLPFLTPISRTAVDFPLAGRWRHKIEGTGLVHNNIKEFRLKIDIKAKKEFNWRPYMNGEILVLIPHDILDGCQYWCAVTPLINFAFVEIQFGDRVLRQFHFHQPIPRSPWDHDLLQILDGRRQVNWVETHDQLHRFDGRRKENVNWVENHAIYINAWNNRASFMPILDDIQDDDFNFETSAYLAYFLDNGKPFLTTIVERRQFLRFKKRFSKAEYSIPSGSGGSSQQPEAEMTDVDNSAPQPFGDAYIPEFVQPDASIYSPMFSSTYDFEHMSVQMPPTNEEDGYHTPEQLQRPQRIRHVRGITRGAGGIGSPEQLQVERIVWLPILHGPTLFSPSMDCMDCMVTFGELGVHGGRWACMAVHGGRWTCLGMHGGRWAFMGVHGGRWACMGVAGRSQGMHGDLPGRWACMATCAEWAMAESLPTADEVKDNKSWKGIFAVSGIMITLVIYGVLQERIMRVPYGTSKKALNPVAPVYKYCLISVTNILTTTCQYEALKYVSFPVQTLAKCAKMIPVMIWGTFIMQKTYKGFDYLVAFLVTLGCSIFILFPAGIDLSPYGKGRENTVWGISDGWSLGYRSETYFLTIKIHTDAFLVTGSSKYKDVYPDRTKSQLPISQWVKSVRFASEPNVHSGYSGHPTWPDIGFDGFTSTFQDKLFKGYNMEIHNQIFYTTLCSCVLSFTGLVLQGHLLPAVDFVYRCNDCFLDIVLLSTVSSNNQSILISYTIRNFGALTFAAIMTTRQLVSSCCHASGSAIPLAGNNGWGRSENGTDFSTYYRCRSDPATLSSNQRTRIYSRGTYNRIERHCQSPFLDQISIWECMAFGSPTEEAGTMLEKSRRLQPWSIKDYNPDAAGKKTPHQALGPDHWQIG